ncbi:ABC transporter permease [Mesoplasma florum]|uniref:ABC transporter permease n=1 Tax=Mesoplasma florum TaxID=2151 RepID=UPI000BE392CF|nr:ABC transporter permease [Mesoplasma florum]ATI74312.1 ribose ABC transporter permease [Mesoplasma florum]AVN61327.1 ribose ABC transporter permease [Mesoplasma florum]
METIFKLFLAFFAIFTLAAIAGMFTERSGIVNLGIEGFMTIGALFYTLSIYFIKDAGVDVVSIKVLIIIIAFIFAMIGGSLFSLLHSFMSLKLKTDQVISGTVINLLAQGIGLFVVNIEAVSNGSTINAQISPEVMNGFSFLTAYMLIAFCFSLVIGLYFTFTKTGTRHISAGENPNALDAAGIKVNKYRFVCITISGAIAGLSGAIFVITQTLQNFDGSVQGLGFISLAIMIIGQWRVSLIVFFSGIFSIMFAIGTGLDIGSQFRPLTKALPFMMSIFVMVIASKWSSPPQASGIAFDKTLR